MMKILKKIGSALTGILVAVELVAIIFIVVMRLSGGVPSLFGYNLFVIVSPSMEPEICVGDIIISKEYDGELLYEGQVITYLGKEGDVKDKIVTHKVVNVLNGGETVITRGVANSSNDPAIGKDDIISVMVYKTFLIGKIYSLLSTTWGFLLLVLIPMMTLIVSEIVSLVMDIRREGETDSDGEGIEKEK